MIPPKDGMIKLNGKDMVEVENQAERIEVRAPMSGVFYRKPAPDQAPYVEVGDEVKKKQTLALLETMKVFQKIKSPANGRVAEIVAQDEAALKDDDLLFVIEKT
jgi:acetyl-CoA carboxylase biotin carboxyl carrier protein